MFRLSGRNQLDLFVTSLLEQLVPEDHILARADRVLDLGWLREEVPDCYYADNGRPGIGPEIVIRLMLACLLLEYVDDRRLMSEAHMSIAILWLIGNGLHRSAQSRQDEYPVLPCGRSDQTQAAGSHFCYNRVSQLDASSRRTRTVFYPSHLHAPSWSRGCRPQLFLSTARASTHFFKRHGGKKLSMFEYLHHRFGRDRLSAYRKQSVVNRVLRVLLTKREHRDGQSHDRHISAGWDICSQCGLKFWKRPSMMTICII